MIAKEVGDEKILVIHTPRKVDVKSRFVFGIFSNQNGAPND